MSTDDHPWHQVSPGDHIPDLVNAIIEIPKGNVNIYDLYSNYTEVLNSKDSVSLNIKTIVFDDNLVCISA